MLTKTYDSIDRHVIFSRDLRISDKWAWKGGNNCASVAIDADWRCQRWHGRIKVWKISCTCPPDVLLNNLYTSVETCFRDKQNVIVSKPITIVRKYFYLKSRVCGRNATFLVFLLFSRLRVPFLVQFSFKTTDVII